MGFSPPTAEPLQPGPEGGLGIRHAAGSGDRQLQLLRGNGAAVLWGEGKRRDLMVILWGFWLWFYGVFMDSYSDFTGIRWLRWLKTCWIPFINIENLRIVLFGTSLADIINSKWALHVTCELWLSWLRKPEKMKIEPQQIGMYSII